MYDVDNVLLREMQEEDEIDTILDTDGDLIDLVDIETDSSVNESADIFNTPIRERKEIDLI